MPKHEPIEPNPFAHLMPSERHAAPDLNTVNENGEPMVKIGAYYYTEAEAAIERQSRHDYCQTLRDQRAAKKAEDIAQSEKEEESWRDFSRRTDAAYSAPNEDRHYSKTEVAKSQKQTDQGPIRFGEVLGAIFILFFALFLYFILKHGGAL
jgi:hypothetical protein